jgi:hypothetical protein
MEGREEGRKGVGEEGRKEFNSLLSIVNMLAYKLPHIMESIN